MKERQHFYSVTATAAGNEKIQIVTRRGSWSMANLTVRSLTFLHFCCFCLTVFDSCSKTLQITWHSVPLPATRLLQLPSRNSRRKEALSVFPVKKPQQSHAPHAPHADCQHGPTCNEWTNEHRVTFSGRLNIHQQALNNTLDPAPECFQNLWLSQLWTSLKATISTKKHRKIVRKMDVEWSAMNGLQPPKSKFEASHEESHDRTLLLPPDREEINETIKFKMHQICIKYVSNM